jgi:Winged helix-turn helix/DDE superfamily endonuclease
MPQSAALLIPPEDLATLPGWSAATQAPAVQVQRARILLLAAEGVANSQIAERLGVCRPTVIARRKRYSQEGLSGRLADRHRRGRLQTVRRTRCAEILAATLTPPPEHLGVTHWSSRLLASELGVSHSTVARVWAEHVVGLYLDPPAHAIVLCVDEKSQIQALERTQPVQPVAPGRVERRTHDYFRHGTTTLFAALKVATGRVTDACHPRHRHREFLAFLRLVAKAYPRRQLHVVVDNYGTNAQARQGSGLAGPPSTDSPALYADLWLLVEPG